MNLEHFQTGVVERLGWVLVHSLWQFTLLALMAALLVRALRNSSSSRRYAALVGLFGIMMAMPALSWLVFAPSPGSQHASISDRNIVARPNEPHARRTDSSQANSDLLSRSRPGASSAAPTAPPEGKAPRARARAQEIGRGDLRYAAATWSRSAAQALRPWLSRLVIAWCLGVALFAIRPLLGLFAVRRLRRVGITSLGEEWSRRLERLSRRLGLERNVELWRSSLATVPVVIGYLRPAILLPVGVLANLSVAELEAILAHELAHIRRHDYLVNLLQTLCETLFFYHPAIWWLSRRIRAAREDCCDDIAVGACDGRVAYSRALLRLEESRGAEPGLAMGATGGSLARRITRILQADLPGQPTCGRHADGRGSLGATLALGTAIVMALAWVCVVANTPPLSSAARANPVEGASRKQGKSSEAVDGLELRVITVATTTDEQKPEMDATAATEFEQTQDLTIVAELKNVSDKPIKLVGVRYGENVSAPSIGESNTRHFGPILFRCEFQSKKGEPIEPPLVTANGDQFLELSSARVETLEPKQSYTCLLRPLQDRHDARHWLPGGEYQMRVHYVGMSEATQETIQKHWPDNDKQGAWHGDVVSNPVAIQFSEPARLDLAWGETTEGLQAAIEFRDMDTYRAQGQPAPARHEFPLEADLMSIVHVKNVSQRTIAFWTEDFRQGDSIEVTDPEGNVKNPGVPFYTGWAQMKKWTLQPGQIAAVYTNIGAGLMASNKNRGRGEPSLSPDAISKPGKYLARIELNFGNVRTKDADGNPIPGEQDFSGTIRTGQTPIVVRERRAEDDPPKFTGRLRLQSTTGRAIEGAVLKVREVAGGELWNGALTGSLLELPNIIGKQVYGTVRAAGFEEQSFYRVQLAADTTAVLELTPAKPTQFQLVTREGQPVIGAKIRYFNRSKFKAAAGPYPMQGTEGEIWATSDENGRVLLDTLQEIDPLDRKLGNNIYWFYVDAGPKLAPRFVGPLQAGQDLGEVPLGPFLEVRGEVRGTPDELEHFRAEWDQPEAMLRGAGESSWDYAVSRTLETTREGDKLVFHLTGLRPGRLRFVSNFLAQGSTVSHEYSKRIPGEKDVVLEIELTDSRDDVVLANSPKNNSKPEENRKQPENKQQENADQGARFERESLAESVAWNEGGLADAWPVFRGDATSSGVATSSLPEKLDVIWKRTFVDGCFEATAAICDGMVFVGSLDGNLYALDLATGDQRWKFFQELGFRAPAAVRDGVVYVADAGGTFFALDALTGSEHWKFATNAEVNAGANFFQDKVLVASQDGTLYCLKTQNGELAWKYSIENRIQCSPTVAGERCFLAGCDGKLHIINIEDGNAVAQLDILDATGNTPAVLGDHVYFGTQGARFFCVNWRKPEIEWTYNPTKKSPCQSSAAVTSDLVVFGGRDRILHALKRDSGVEAWEFPAKSRIDSSPVVVGDRVFFGASDGRMYGLKLSSGEPVWEFEAGGALLSSPAVAANRLVIGSDSGDLYCFGEQ